MSQSKVEFYLSVVEAWTNGARVQGRVNVGELRVGDRFDRAWHDAFGMRDSGTFELVERQDVRQTDLAIEEILSYGRQLDSLSAGMTGQLLLSGQGSKLLNVQDTIAYQCE